MNVLSVLFNDSFFIRDTISIGVIFDPSSKCENLANEFSLY